VTRFTAAGVSDLKITVCVSVGGAVVGCSDSPSDTFTQTLRDTR